MQIGLRLYDSSCRCQQTVGYIWLKRNMSPTREVSIGTMQSLVKLLQESYPQKSVTTDVGCSKSAVSKIWYKYLWLKKGKFNGGPGKTSKRQDRKLTEIGWEKLEIYPKTNERHIDRISSGKYKNNNKKKNR